MKYARRLREMLGWVILNKLINITKILREPRLSSRAGSFFSENHGLTRYLSPLFSFTTQRFSLVNSELIDKAAAQFTNCGCSKLSSELSRINTETTL